VYGAVRSPLIPYTEHGPLILAICTNYFMVSPFSEG